MMKKFMYLWCAFVFLGLVACSDETPEEQPERMFALTNLNYSGCKSYVESRSIGDNEYFELKGTQAGNLLVKHANAVFNCASDKFEAKASIEGKTITVTELDVIKDGVMVKCICPYDLDYERLTVMKQHSVSSIRQRCQRLYPIKKSDRNLVPVALFIPLPS